jgi:hypothetical protein
VNKSTASSSSPFSSSSSRKEQIVAQLKVDCVHVKPATLKEFFKAFPQHKDLATFEHAVVLINWLTFMKETYKRCQSENVQILIQNCGCKVFGLSDQQAQERWTRMESDLSKLDCRLWPWETGLKESYLFHRNAPTKVGLAARPPPEALAAWEKKLFPGCENAKAVPMEETEG